MRLFLLATSVVAGATCIISFPFEVVQRDEAVFVQSLQTNHFCGIGDTVDTRVQVVNCDKEQNIKLLGAANVGICSNCGCVQLLGLPLDVPPDSSAEFVVRFSAKASGVYSEKIELLLDRKPRTLVSEFTMTVF